MEVSKPFYKIKVLLCGPTDSKKTEILMEEIKSKFKKDFKLSIGVDIITKEIILPDNKKVALSIWDIGGNERFSFVRKTYYRGGAGAVLIFDLTNLETWVAIKAWYEEMIQYTGKIPFLLIGNLIESNDEIKHAVDNKECQNWATSRGGLYLETNSKTHEGVDQNLILLTETIIKQKN